MTAAAEKGFAYASPAAITVGGRRYTGEGLAVGPLHRNETELPLHEGRAVYDEPFSSVYLLMRHESVGPVSRRTNFG